MSSCSRIYYSRSILYTENDYTLNIILFLPDTRDERPPGGKRGPPAKGREDAANKKARSEYDEDVYGPRDVTDWSEVPEFLNDSDENNWLGNLFY